MLKLAAYADRLSVRPGETIRFHAANATGAPVTARLARVVCADPNPAGPGVRLEPVGETPTRLGDPGPADVPRGSSAMAHVPLRAPAAVTLSLRVMPTLIGPDDQGIVGWSATDGQEAFALVLDRLGHVALHLAVAGATRTMAASGRPLALDRWADVTVTLDRARMRARLVVQPLATGRPAGASDTVEATLTDQVALDGAGTFLIAAAPTPGSGTFNGRIEAPRITAHDTDGSESVIAAWDFARDVDSQRIVDTGPGGHHGTLDNTPTRAVTGSTWTGREMCFRHAPSEYGAIHFHDDDIDDCRWPAAFEWTVPTGLRSGNYALFLEAGAERENVPFFVVPAKGTQTARLAVLVSTFTYTVYGNHERFEWRNSPAWREAWMAQAAAWGAYPANPGDHREYGLSTYNFHTDGSGIAHASCHRPMLNVRVGYMTYPYPDLRGSGLRHYPADTHLTAWLEAKGIAYDLITDHELHHEGADLLSRYTCVLTGTHPEYHTRAMLDALKAYRDGGGRLCYLGGNGFYWKIALDPARPGHIEIRRGEGGIRAWAADPGEYYNQFDGEYGGLWRRNGRPPQDLVGVGFTAQGNFHGSYYRRTAEASDSRVAWMFAGVEGDIIGDFGLSAHGAAGFELDRTDKRLGTPANAIVVARSENHPADAPWVLVPEEQLTHLATVAGLPSKDLIRADMTFFTTAEGRGAVFSTGSITYCGALPVNGFDNPVSRLTENVVHRFLDPAPFG